VSRKLSVSMILISHNFGVISELCDRVAVMYAGTLVELADILTIYERPAHPYTIGLIRSVPKFEDRSERFSSIRGSIPSPANLPSGCVFNPRCDFVKDDCRAKVPELIELEKGHFVSCLHWREVLG
jgi:peptide/nickel transport system ATP-binding protein